MNNDYAALIGLYNTAGYKILEELWIHQVSEIEKSRDSAAKRGSETAWRYYAGQEKGFKLAMTALARAIEQIEKEEGETSGSAMIDKLFGEIKK